MDSGLKMKKVIYIAIFAPTELIEKYLYIRDVIDAGFKVEYWDLSRIYFKDHQFKNTISDPYVRKIGSFQELKTCLRNEQLAETLFIVQVNFERRVIPLYFLLTRWGCKTAFFALVPQLSKGLLSKACKKIGLIKEYDLVFAVGENPRDTDQKCCQTVRINYLDYDRYQLSKNNTGRMVFGDYCVFIDEGSIFNEDVKIAKLGHLDPGLFYTELNRFFDDIEMEYKRKVVIAAHPGIKYDKEIFHGREVYEGKTCDLVKDCQCVVSLASCASLFCGAL